VKGHDTLANMTSPLTLSHDPLPVSRDELLSGPEQHQPATPWAQEEGSDRQRSSLMEPLEDRVPPPMELFLAQRAEPEVVLFVSSDFLVSVSVVACLFATCMSLVVL